MILPEKTSASCPYCGEYIELLIDCSVDQQEYIEDCQVCCRPMNIAVEVDGSGWPSITVKTEDE
ncbi:MAG: CPXCG motif-containing cysteine-rich protein [Pseudohongiellaceae bacterium]